MIEVAGKPFIAHQFDLIKKNKLKNVIICASHLGEQIEKFAGNGSAFGIDIKYSYDGDKLLGTGGAIKKAFPVIQEDTFFVMYGDSYLNTDFQKINEYFFLHDKNGLMTVFRNEGMWDKSNIEFRNENILKYDKKNANEDMKYIDYGLGMLRKKAFDDFKSADEFDLEKVYQNLLGKNDLLGYEVNERFYEIGSFEGLEELKRAISTS